MSENVDWSRLSSLDTIRYSNEAHRLETATLLAQATQYIIDQAWCVAIHQRFLGLSEAGLVGVFLLEVTTTQNNTKWLWAVVGDVPPLYIAASNARNQYQALNCYIGEIDYWIRCIKNKHIPDDCPPIKHNTDEVSLAYLEHKLDILDNTILKPASHLLQT